MYHFTVSEELKEYVKVLNVIHNKAFNKKLLIKINNRFKRRKI